MELIVINRTPNIEAVDVAADKVVIRLGEIDRKKLTDIRFDLETNDFPLDITNVEAGCRACTKVFTKRLSSTQVEVRVEFNWKMLTNFFNKRITFSYRVGDKTFKQVVFVNGKIK